MKNIHRAYESVLISSRIIYHFSLVCFTNDWFTEFDKKSKFSEKILLLLQLEVDCWKNQIVSSYLY